MSVAVAGGRPRTITLNCIMPQPPSAWTRAGETNQPLETSLAVMKTCLSLNRGNVFVWGVEATPERHYLNNRCKLSVRRGWGAFRNGNVRDTAGSKSTERVVGIVNCEMHRKMGAYRQNGVI